MNSCDPELPRRARRLIRHAIVIFSTLASIAATAASTEAPQRVVSAADFASAESPTSGIQEAIDALGADGGIVTIPAGEYALRQSIRVRSGVTLRGSGELPVLRKNPQAGSRLAQPAQPQSRAITLLDASGFRPGDQIAIFDRQTVGWLHALAVVREVNGNELLLDRRVGRAFEPKQDAAAINYFSAITGTDVANVVIENLYIDGRPDENPGVARVAPRPLELGFNFAAINLVGATHSRIENCRVAGWPADGISLQRGGHNTVARCVVERCRGEGIHPGGGLRESVFTGNVAAWNLANGFFFCARVERVTVTDSRFFANGRSGIGGLGSSGDTLNVVRNNVCEENAMHGIELIGGTANTVIGNTCTNNSRSRPGRWSGILLAATTQSTVSGNRCADTQPRKTQKHGIEELADCRGNEIDGNECHGNRVSDVAKAGVPGRGESAEK